MAEIGGDIRHQSESLCSEHRRSNMKLMCHIYVVDSVMLSHKISILRLLSTTEKPTRALIVVSAYI